MNPGKTRYLALGAVLITGLLVFTSAGAAAGAAHQGVTVEQIMANTDWIGNPPEEAYWGDDSQSIYYLQKREGSKQRDLFRTDVTGAPPAKIPDARRGATPAPGGDYDRGHTRKVYALDGDIFVKDLKSGSVTQITRTEQSERAPHFSADGKRIYWKVDNTFYVRDLASGLTSQPAAVLAEDDPATDDKPYSYLRHEQLEMFDVLKEKKKDEDEARARQRAMRAADPTRAPEPFYLGSKVKIAMTSLSPNGRWLMVITTPKDYDGGKKGMMPEWVTRSGYVETVETHTRVGHNLPAPEQVWVLDLDKHTVHKLDQTQLPGIKQDPLAKLRKAAVKWDVAHGVDKKKAEASVKAPDVRPVTIWGLAWSDDGKQLALEFHATDNKDRWIASVDFGDDYRLVTQNRLSDNAWINWDFNDFGWLHDNRTLWYLSEQSNYSHIYLTAVDASHTRKLTDGRFEVTDPIVDREDHYFYFAANDPDPTTFEIFRVDIDSGKMEQVTHLGGLNGPQPSMEELGRGFELSPDESKLLVYHSTSVSPPELYVQPLDAGSPAKRVTHTVSARFAAIHWDQPQIVKVPSSHVREPIYARLFTPADFDPAHHKYPAVMFIHGAGYLQEAHQGWSYYKHELMFHTLLTQHGYVVLDMDYRGSAGYGRNWRTAIYRDMGHPEVEDLVDGVHWLEKNEGVDPAHVGVYGGSYGGFLTYMAMFREPDLFAAGAALRPVGDWANYNQEYSSNILNTPEVDPEAYERSSPIKYVAGLKHPLLICQGMLDDNVFFIDTVHITQRLIELKNPNFQVAFYPVEHHGFKRADSWLDEYRRIYKLFQTHVAF